MENFNKHYNKIFEKYEDKSSGYRSKKSQFKKEYNKYLETGNINKFKHSLKIFIAYVELSEHSSPSLDSMSSGVST